MKKLERLIESMVQESLLLEDDDGGDDSGAYPSGIYNDYYDSMGYGGGGSGHGYGNALYQTFVQPLTDIYHTAMYGLKMLSASAQQIVRQVLVNVPKLLVPFYNTEDYQSLLRRRNAKLQAIENKYTEVLKRNIEYLHDHDLQGMAFLLDPSLFLGAKLVQQTPAVAQGLLELVGLGTNLYTSKEMNSLFGPKLYQHESLIREGNEQILQMASNPQVAKKLLELPEVKSVQNEILGSIVEQVKEFLAIPTFEELLKHTKGSLSPVQQQLNASYRSKQITPNDVPNTKQALLVKIKTDYQKHYIEMLKKLKTMAPGAATAITKAISQISSLKIA